MSETESFAAASPGDEFVYLPAFQQLVLDRTHDLITVLDPTGTYLLKTNLSTLTHSGADELGLLVAAPDPTQVYAATLVFQAFALAGAADPAQTDLSRLRRSAGPGRDAAVGLGGRASRGGAQLLGRHSRAACLARVGALARRQLSLQLRRPLIFRNERVGHFLAQYVGRELDK